MTCLHSLKQLRKRILMVLLMSQCVCVCARVTSVYLLCCFSFLLSFQPSAFSSGDPFRSGSPKTKDSGTLSFITGHQFTTCVTVLRVFLIYNSDTHVEEHILVNMQIVASSLEPPVVS